MLLPKVTVYIVVHYFSQPNCSGTHTVSLCRHNGCSVCRISRQISKWEIGGRHTYIVPYGDFAKSTNMRILKKKRVPQILSSYAPMIFLSLPCLHFLEPVERTPQHEVCYVRSSPDMPRTGCWHFVHLSRYRMHERRVFPWCTCSCTSKSAYFTVK